ncbi:hypothetical protein [Arthrobacter sp. UYCo732]|uniref:hypothetical protein n=1 Tax=Arthrobacter sp. UYCo732 TaxID=3156336 RepID=UPI00339278AE
MSATRQPKGVPVGGQFAATGHADPSLHLRLLKQAEDVFAYSPGTRVMTGNEFGTISHAGKDANGNVAVELDQGGTLHLKADRVVPWEAHLDSVMPVPERNPDRFTDAVPQADADRQLRASLARLRNARETSGQAETPYFDGIAVGEAEICAALSNADADPETIQRLRGDFLATDLDEFTVPEIKKRSAAPLSMVRARRLAGYFTSRAVEMQQELGSKPSNDWRDAEWIKNGAKTAFTNAAVRFASAAAPSDNRYHEERFTRLLVEGETNTDTIIGETFDEHAW